ncbi:MAG: caspase family protein [Saprospiraceae bacterium]|nr:caspase family protein [Saprospiraceae bacterium]
MPKINIPIFLIGLLPILLLWSCVLLKKQTQIDSDSSKTYFGQRDGVFNRIIENQEGEFVLVGTTKDENGGTFFTIMDSTGKRCDTPVNWVGTEGAKSVIQTSDSNYVIAGFMGKEPNRSAWLVKINAKGLVQWTYKDTSAQNSVFMDIVEASNDTLWLTGESNNQLWVVQMSADGKELKRTLFRDKEKEETIGNGLVWDKNDRDLVVVGTATKDRKQKQLLLTVFDTEGDSFRVKTKTRRKENAEGRGIAVDPKGYFGVVGTSYTYTLSDILFAYYDHNFEPVKERATTFGHRYKDNEEGFGITTDKDSGFIIVGQYFENPSDYKTQAFVNKVSVEGIWGNPKPFGHGYNDVFNNVVVSERGNIIAVGSYDDGQKSCIEVIPQKLNTPSKQQKIDSIKPFITCWLNGVLLEEGKKINLPDNQGNSTLRIKVELGETSLNESNIEVWINNRKYEYTGVLDFKGTIVQSNTSTTAYNYVFTRTIFFEKPVSTLQIRIVDKPQLKRTPIFKVNKRLPNLYILAIGIDYKDNPYPNDTIKRLRHTDNDADSIMSIFETQRNNYGTFHHKVLKTPDSTKAVVIRETINTFFRNIKPTDIALLFVSGHGSMYNSKRAKIWGSDYNINDNNKKTYLDYEEDIRTPLKKLDAKIFTFIDACRTQDPSLIPMGNNSSNDAMATIMNAPKAYRQLLSCRDGEKSFEYKNQPEQSLFTEALLNAFRNRPSYNKEKIPLRPTGEGDKFLTFRQLCIFVEQTVPYLADLLGEKQHPIYDKETGDDIPIFIFKR